jgi:hypothetical protein
MIIKRKKKYLLTRLKELSERELEDILKEFFKGFPISKRKNILINLSVLAFPSMRYETIKNWMEKKYKSEPNFANRKPFVMARMCRNYMKIDPRMIPLLIKLARNSKRRVKREKEKAL